MHTCLLSFGATYLLSFFFVLTNLTASLSEPNILRLTLDKEQDLLHFRTIDQPFKSTNGPLPSREGLSDLHLSGSAQFSEKGLQTIKTSLGNKNIHIIDLRKESHGFINGLPVAWVFLKGWPNSNMTAGEIQTQERELLTQALHTKDLELFIILKNNGEKSIVSTTICPNTMSTEQELCNKEGIHYYRIPVDDHMRPVDSEVDRFIAFVNSLPQDAWLHFHCKGGAGRTTTFMTLYDMMHNAKKVTVDDIINRQWLLGRTNLASYTKRSVNKYSEEFDERLIFLKKFYLYCQENKDNYQTSWTDWLSRQSR